MKVKAKQRIFLFPLLVSCCSLLLVTFLSQQQCPLVDYTYQLENAYRIYRGQVPYRDFFLVVAPGIYYLMALFMRLFGTGNAVQIQLLLIIQLFTILLSFLILQRVLKDRWIIHTLLLLLIGSGQGYTAIASYDILCTLTILVNLYVTLRACEASGKPRIALCFLSGLSAVLPLVCKQNMGAVYLVVYLASLFCILLLRKISLRTAALCFGGTVAALLFLMGWIYFSGIGGNIYAQMFVFPGEARPIAAALRRLYQMAYAPVSLSYLFLLLGGVLLTRSAVLKPGSKRVALALVALCAAVLLPALWWKNGGIYAVRNNLSSIWYMFFFASIWMIFYALIEKKFLYAGILLALNLTAAATLLSHGVASDYGIWPLMVCILALLMRSLSEETKRTIKPAVLITVISLSVLCVYASVQLYGVKYTPSDEARTRAQGVLQEKAYGLVIKGSFLPDFENLVAYVNETVPQEDTLIAWPGEDPIYWATDRRPDMPYFQLYHQTIPKTMDEVFADAMAYEIDWIIIKTECQLNGFLLDGSNYIEYAAKLEQEGYTLEKAMDRYWVYRRGKQAL